MQTKPTSTKLEKIEQLAIRSKNGDQQAIKELLELFNPLIYKTSGTIHSRYGDMFPTEEVAKQAKSVFILLLLSHYTPGGKAQFPYFIKQSLHAELVKIYRPIFTFSCKTVEIEDESACSDPFITLYQNERIDIYKKLRDYIDKQCNEREKDMIDVCMDGTLPRNVTATKYGVSANRIRMVYIRLMKKLRKHAYTLGIRRKEDI